MQAPSLIPQMIHCKPNRLWSILLSLTGVFGVTEGPGIHMEQLKWTHSYNVSVGGI